MIHELIQIVDATTWPILERVRKPTFALVVSNVGFATLSLRLLPKSEERATLIH